MQLGMFRYVYLISMQPARAMGLAGGTRIFLQKGRVANFGAAYFTGGSKYGPPVFGTRHHSGIIGIYFKPSLPSVHLPVGRQEGLN